MCKSPMVPTHVSGTGATSVATRWDSADEAESGSFTSRGRSGSRTPRPRGGEKTSESSESSLV